MLKNEKAWTDWSITPWLVRPGIYPTPLFCCKIAALSLIDEDRPYWICSHCGSFVKNRLNCPGCNAPRKGTRSNRGFVEVHGLLPQAKVINEITTGFQLQCVYREYGDQRDAQGGTTILVMDSCQVREKWIEGFDAMFGSDENNEVLRLCILLSCDIRLNFEPTEGLIFDWDQYWSDNNDTP